MIHLKITDHTNDELNLLIRELDIELRGRYGSYQDNFDGQNKLDSSVVALLAFEENLPVACGALRPMAEAGTVEVKRMFVKPGYRRKGISLTILTALENLAKEKGYSTIKLETGKNQPEAIALYLKCGYKITEPYGAYKVIDKAICMEKKI